MMGPQSPALEIPQKGDVFTDCARRLLVFCATDPSYFGYDAADQDHSPAAPDVITDSQLHAANAAMRAFAFRTDWEKQGIIGTRLPELDPALLPLDTDLLALDDAEWAGLRPHVEAAYRRLVGRQAGTEHRIGTVAASKVLHLKRPRLFAIVDSHTRAYWGCQRTDPVALAMAVTEEVRLAGRYGHNPQALNACAAYLDSHPLGGKPVAMSGVRMLDALVWMKMSANSQMLWEALGWRRL